MSSKVELEVTQGQIVVNHGWCVVDQPDCVIWEFDLKSKYPEGYVYLSWSDLNGDGDTANESMAVHLFAGERTLRADKDTDRPTIIVGKVDAPHERWTIIADWARYTVRICFFKYPDLDQERETLIYNKENAK